MTDYKTIAESKNFIVLDKYTAEWKAAEGYQTEEALGKSCKTLRNVWYMSACNGILTGHEAKQP